MSFDAGVGGMTEGVKNRAPAQMRSNCVGRRKAPPRLRPRRHLYKEWRGRKGIRPSEAAPRGWEAPAANADAGGAAARRHLLFHDTRARAKNQPTFSFLRSIAASWRGRVRISRSTHRRTDDSSRIFAYNRGMEEDQDRLAEIIGKNIIRHRKTANMTQSDLTEQLN